MKTNKITAYSAQLILTCLIIVFFILKGHSQASAMDNTIQTITILPVQINSSQNLNYIHNGIIRMFDSRLSWEKKVKVISGNKIKNLTLNKNEIPASQFIYQIGKQTNSNFILCCSLTELSGSFSIEAKVYDMENKRYMPFFETSKKIDDIIEKTDHIAAGINKKIFKRTTAGWEKMEKEKLEYINKLKRRNPEYLIKKQQWENSKESHGWKIWKYLF